MPPGGPVEEVSKVTSGLIDALKGQPAVLALTVANIGMMIFIYYALHAAATFRDTLIRQMFEESKQINQLLAQCNPPSKTQAGPTLPVEPIDEKPRSVDDPPKSSGEGGP